MTQARIEAISALIDEALAEVRSTVDVSMLQECRAIFRKKVPLHLRSAVAASLFLNATARQASQGRRRDEEAPRKQKNATREEAKQPKAKQQENADRPAKQQAKQPAQKNQKPKDQVQEEPKQAPRIRENRYQGEGITLFVSAGRRQRFYARVVLKTLCEDSGIPESAVGDIRTMDNYSFIIVDPAIEEQVVSLLNGYDFKGRTLTANRARKKDEDKGDAALEGETRRYDRDSGETDSFDDESRGGSDSLGEDKLDDDADYDEPMSSWSDEGSAEPQADEEETDTQR